MTITPQLGPIVGYTTETTTRIWFRPRNPGQTYHVRLWLHTGQEEQLRWDPLKGDGTFVPTAGVSLLLAQADTAIGNPTSTPDTFKTRIAVFTGLQAGQRYFYDIVEDPDAAPPEATWSFRTMSTSEAWAIRDNSTDGPAHPRIGVNPLRRP